MLDETSNRYIFKVSDVDSTDSNFCIVILLSFVANFCWIGLKAVNLGKFCPQAFTYIDELRYTIKIPKTRARRRPSTSDDRYPSNYSLKSDVVNGKRWRCCLVERLKHYNRGLPKLTTDHPETAIACRTNQTFHVTTTSVAQYSRREWKFSFFIFYCISCFLFLHNGRQVSAAMTITQTLRYLRNFGYLYDSINHKDFDFNGGPLPILSTDQNHQPQPVNLRHSIVDGRRRSAAAALHFHSPHHHPQYDNSTASNYISHSSRYDSDAISTAVKRFQAFSSLPITGQIDSRTLRQLRKPRCGNIDLQPNRAKTYLHSRGAAGMPANYILQGSKWDRTDLTFKIGQYSRTLSRKAVDEVISEAFSYWSNASKLTFRQIHYGPADIIILFAKGEHGDLSPFDGPQGVLAHAFFPDFGGDTHFDDAERWTHGKKRGVNLLQVAVHELGHALGLDHSDVSQALHADDIKGIRRLYGPPPEIAVVTATRSPANASSTTLMPTTTITAQPPPTTFPTTSSTTTTTISSRTSTIMPFEDVGAVTRQHQVDEEAVLTFDDTVPQSFASADSSNGTTDNSLLSPVQHVFITSSTTPKIATDTPVNATSTTPLNTALWWPPPANKAVDKNTDSKSTFTRKLLHNSDSNNSLPFFGTPFDDVWIKKHLHTVKGKRINSASKVNSTTSIISDLNNNQSLSSTAFSNEYNVSTTVAPEEWSLFGLEDLTLQTSRGHGAKKRLHKSPPSAGDEPSTTTTTTTSATTTTTNSDAILINSFEGLGSNASLHINLCDSSFRIDAITTIDGVGFMFAGDAYWRVSPMGEVLQPARSILADWKSTGSSTVPTHIDAALSPTWAQGRTYLFKGDKYWRVNHGEIKSVGSGPDRGQQFYIEDGYPKSISTGWAGIPDNIESAFQWGRSTRTYFTKGNEIWSFDRTQVPPVRGPKTMPVERGFPGRVDAAFRSPSGRTYLFSEDKYYAMSTWSFLISRYYPQPTGERWFGCRLPTPLPFDTGRQSNFSDVDNNPSLIITPHAAGDIAQINYAPSAPDDYGNVTTNAPLMTDVVPVIQPRSIFPTDIVPAAEPPPASTETDHIQWIHSRSIDADQRAHNSSRGKSTTVQTFVETSAMPTQPSSFGGTSSRGEFLWQSRPAAVDTNKSPEVQHLSNLEALRKSGVSSEVARVNRQPNRAFRNPTGRQVRFQPPSSLLTEERAATSISQAETNAIALSSRRISSSFGARQFYNHNNNNQLRSKRSTSSNHTEEATARRPNVFYLRRERKLHPLP